MPQQPNSARPASVAGAARMVILALAIASPALCAQPANIVDTPVSAAQSSLHAFDIPAQALDDALLVFARQAGVEVAMGDASLAEKRSTALHGRFPLEQGLQQLLAGTDMGFYLQPTGANSLGIRIYAPGDDEPGLAKLAPVVVKGNVELDRDTAGYDAVYDENYSSVYAGKEQIERYKGSSPADLFKGMANVYSGDARNSGAVDPNIRGIQGPGRIPLTVDGAEQAMTVYRGYAGASNRNYIDPNLLGSVQVIKGPNLLRDVKTGVGGAVAAKTLEVLDILKDGESWGGDLKIEGSNNTVKPRMATSYIGQDYRDVVEQSNIRGSSYNGWQSIGFSDPLSNVPIREKKDNRILNIEDQAYRLALAARQEKYEALVVYAYRDRGNYFAGKKNHDFYLPQLEHTYLNALDFVHYMAHAYKPGNEITNTSSEMESWMLKGKLNISDEQGVSIGYRDSTQTYGEIMPSMIPLQEILEQDGDRFMLPQWPLSEVAVKAYNLDYQYQPGGSRYIDLNAKIWMTDTDSATYSGSGLPHALIRNYSDSVFGTCWRNGENNCPRDPNIPFAPLLDTGLTKASHTRQGFHLSNRINLTENLNLTVSGDFQYEKLSGKDDYEETKNYGTYRVLPRSGRRQEYELNFNFDWQPKSWLTVTAGARRMSYWINDDFRRDRVKAGDTAFSTISTPVYRLISYRLQTDALTKEQQDVFAKRMEEYYRQLYTTQGESGINSRYSDPDLIESDVQSQLSRSPFLESALGTPQRLDFEAVWLADENGDFSVENNPFFNGEFDPKEFEYSYIRASTTSFVGKEVPLKTWRDNGWVPALGIAADLSKDGRLYLNYSEALRFPSMFEGTLGFSASAKPNGLKPEHAHFNEIGYVHNLSNIFDAYADIKIAYFHNVTKNVIDRNSSLRFSNLEKQTLSGLELQARYDSGIIFADFSLVYNRKNEVCDKKFASMTISDAAYSGDVALKKCADNGFPGGYLAAMAVPKYMANTTIGARFFNKSLELGSRAIYYYKNDKAFSEAFTPESGGVLASPLFWDDILTFDAFAGYVVNDNVTIDLVGTNLTNVYYADPLSRSATAAPGRTFKLGLTVTF